MGRPTTDYKLVVRLYCGKVAIDHASLATFPQSDNYYVYIFVMHTDCLSSCLAALQVALVVAQRRESGGRLSGIKLSALSIGLQRVAKMARKKKGKNSFFNLLNIRMPLPWY